MKLGHGDGAAPGLQHPSPPPPSGTIGPYSGRAKVERGVRAPPEGGAGAQVTLLATLPSSWGWSAISCSTHVCLDAWPKAPVDLQEALGKHT